MAAQVSAAISATSATSAGSGRAASFGSILAVISGPCSCDVALQRAGPGHWNPRQWANFAPGSSAQGQAGRRFFGRAFHACPKAPDCRPAPASAACFAGHLRPRAKGGRSSGAKPAALSACRTRFTLATMRGVRGTASSAGDAGALVTLSNRNGKRGSYCSSQRFRSSTCASS